jgi:hypothetical protein
MTVFTRRPCVFHRRIGDEDFTDRIRETNRDRLGIAKTTRIVNQLDEPQDILGRLINVRILMFYVDSKRNPRLPTVIRRDPLRIRVDSCITSMYVLEGWLTDEVCANLLVAAIFNSVAVAVKSNLIGHGILQLSA